MKSPEKNFNACDDFFELVTTSHILTAALEVLVMTSLSDTPSEAVISDPPRVWMQMDKQRKQILTTVCEKIVDSYIHFAFHEVATPVDDNVNEYSRQLLSIECLYLEFADAIREGDGLRVLRCWRYLLPIFKSSSRKNYSIEALNMLCQHHHELTPRQSAELIWSRFVNVHGLPGRNIPGDLYMEHLNRICKDAIRGLGANQTEKAITRVGRALGTLSPVLDQYDKDNLVQSISAIRSIPGSQKDRDLIMQQLQDSKVFSITPGRKHPTFSRVRHMLHSTEKSKLLKWIVEHL